MATYLISYDLKKPGRNYDDLYKRIKSYTTWAMITESTWAVVSAKTAKEVFTHIQGALDNNDILFVITVGGTAWWSNNLPDDVVAWLKKRL